MAQGETIHSSGEVQDQVILPLRVAVGICLRGIRTRLGRSAITLFGVGLGIAFLMAVLSGFHIQRAMSAHAAIARDVERRLAALRSELGALNAKRFIVVRGEGNEADAGLLRALVSQGCEVHDALSEDIFRAHAVLLLGRFEPLLAPHVVALLRDKPAIVFAQPAAGIAALVAASGGRLRHLGIELRPDEVAQAARRERQATYRMAWVVGVSLLITVGCIANAMLMSVTERFREIGTMKCLGALSSFVVKLFLIESLLMGLVGAALGVLLGAAVPLLAYGYTFGVGKVLAAASFATLGLCGVACVAAGVVLAIVAAIYPARVAAKMVPAAALASHV